MRPFARMQTSHFACVELIERGVRKRRHVILSKFIQITCLFFPAICVNMAAFRPHIESSPKLQEIEKNRRSTRVG